MTSQPGGPAAPGSRPGADLPPTFKDAVRTMGLVPVLLSIGIGVLAVVLMVLYFENALVRIFLVPATLLTIMQVFRRSARKGGGKHSRRPSGTPRPPTSTSGPG